MVVTNHLLTGMILQVTTLKKTHHVTSQHGVSVRIIFPFPTTPPQVADP